MAILLSVSPDPVGTARRGRNQMSKRPEATSASIDFPIRGEEACHECFRELSTVYCFFNRPAFLNEIVNFLRGADKSEIATIRKHVRERAKGLPHGGRRGRPRAADDPDWKRLALKRVWWKEI